MSTGLVDVQKKISEIENAIRHRDVNAGISAYTALRIYSGDTSLDFQTRKLAHDKGIELYAILAQMRQEILQHEQIQESNVRAPQPTYADPMPLKGSIDPYAKPRINFKTIILLVIILGFIGAGTYLFMTGSSSGGCTVDGPFACKETALKASSSTENMGQNYVILKLDASKGIVSQINISAISPELKGCDRVYIDRAHSLATNYEEVKIMFDCKNVTLSEIAGAVTLSYKLDGADQTSTVRLSSVQSAIDTAIKDTLNINTTNNNTSPTPSNTPNTANSNSNVSRNTTTNTTRTNTTTTTNYGSYGGGGGSGGGSTGTGYSVDETPPIMTLEIYSSATTLNSGGTTFNITFKSTGHANYLKNMAYIIFNIGGNTSTCTNTSHLAVCYYTFPCPVSWMGLNKTYSAEGVDDNDFDNTASSTFIVPDFILPTSTVSTSNATSFTSTPVNMTGTASDNFLLSLVEYRVNNGTWHTPTGTTSWNISANIRNGSNTVEIRTTDSFSNVNTTTKSFNATLRPEIDLIIYNNSNLNTNWTNASYNGIINLTNDAVIKDGPYAISFNGNETGALVINMTNNYTINNVDGYNNLSFWINGTNDTAMKIRVRGDASDSQFPDVNLTNLTGEWTLVQVNITQLNPYRQTINKIEIIPVSIPAGETNITFYIESLKVSGKITDTAGPQIGIIYPANNTVINITVGANTKNITIRGNVTDDSYMDRVTVQINDNTTIYNMTQINFTLTTNVTTNWSGVITLVNDTDNIINITAYDIYGKSTIYTINITLNITPDVTAPSVALGAIGLLSGNQTNQTYVTINGTASEEVNGTGLNYSAWRMNGGPWQNTSSTTGWTQAILLANVSNFIELKTMDNSGNNGTANMTIYYNYSTMNALPLIIFDNDNFTSNWSYENASMYVNVTINDTSRIYSGNSSMRVDANATSTFNIMIGNTTDVGVNATNYTKVRFVIYANQSISNLNVTLGFVNNTNITYFGTSTFSVPAMNWTIINASVSTLMAGNSTFNSLGLSINESTNVTYYLDNVQIIP